MNWIHSYYTNLILKACIVMHEGGIGLSFHPLFLRNHFTHFTLALSNRSTPIGGQKIKSYNEALLNRVLSLLPSNLTVLQHSWVLQCAMHASTYIFKHLCIKSVLRALISENKRCNSGHDWVLWACTFIRSKIEGGGVAELCKGVGKHYHSSICLSLRF